MASMHIAQAGAGPELTACAAITFSRSRMSSPTMITHADAKQDATAIFISRWRQDPGGTYQTWFLWGERLKNFRSIRRGLAEVVTEIQAGTFGTSYKGSSLETVVGSIAEQRQMFKGADHARLWKPKLRIPDIHENRESARVREIPARMRVLRHGAAGPRANPHARS
jgi:type II restriction enzyme